MVSALRSLSISVFILLQLLLPAQDTVPERTAFHFNTCVQYVVVSPRMFRQTASDTLRMDIYLSDTSDAFAILQRCLGPRCINTHKTGIWDLRSAFAYTHYGKDQYERERIVFAPIRAGSAPYAYSATDQAGLVDVRTRPGASTKDSLVAFVDTLSKLDVMGALRASEDGHWRKAMFTWMPQRGFLHAFRNVRRDGNNRYEETMRLLAIKNVDTVFTYTDRTFKPPVKPLPPDVIAKSYHYDHVIDYVVESSSSNTKSTKHERVYLADSLVGFGLRAPLNEDRQAEALPEALRSGSLFYLFDSLAQSRYVLFQSWMGRHYTRLNKDWPVAGQPPAIPYKPTGRTKTIQGIPAAEFEHRVPEYTDRVWVSRQQYPTLARGMRRWSEFARSLPLHATGLPPGLLLEGHRTDRSGRSTDWRATALQIKRDTAFTTTGYLQVESFYGTLSDRRSIGSIFNRPPDSVYTFEHTVRITREKGHQVKEHYRALLNTTGYIVGEYVGVNDSLPDGKRLCLHHLDQLLTYTCAAEDGERTASARIPHKLVDRGGDDPLDFRPTGATDTIAGFIAREWKAPRYDDDEQYQEGDMVLWIAERAPAQLRTGMVHWTARFWDTWLVEKEIPPGVIVGGRVIARSGRDMNMFRVDELLPGKAATVNTSGYTMGRH